MLDSGVDENWYKDQPDNAEYERENPFTPEMKLKDTMGSTA